MRPQWLGARVRCGWSGVLEPGRASVLFKGPEVRVLVDASEARDLVAVRACPRAVTGRERVAPAAACDPADEDPSVAAAAAVGCLGLAPAGLGSREWRDDGFPVEFVE